MYKPKSTVRPWNLKPKVSYPMQGRKSNYFYHCARWTIESRLYRQENPLCVECEKEGIIYPAEVVDHIIPLAICEDPWDKSNWQSLCFKHNNKKAAKDKKLIQQYRNEKIKRPENRH